MNLLEITSFCTQKTQLVQTDDVAFAKLSAQRRYQLIYDAYLWKDSLVMLPVNFDPINNADNSDGVILLPEVINRVVAARTINNSVKIQALEYYYRIDYDAFTAGTTNVFGSATQFALLSPVWFIWRGFSPLVLQKSNPVQDNNTVKIVWQDETGKENANTVNNGFALNSSVTQTSIIPDGAQYETTGFYSPNTTVGKSYFYKDPNDGADFYLLNDNVPVPNSSVFKAGTVVMAGVADAVITAFLTGSSSTLVIESMFTPPTVGNVSLNPGNQGDMAGGTLTARITKSPSYQRMRLFAIPNAAITINVLGKKPFIPLNFDYEVPAIKNLDNVLIAFICGDLLKRARQYAKAQTEYQEAASLLQVLADLEAVQAANCQQFVPENGYGDAYFGAGQRGYFGFGY